MSDNKAIKFPDRHYVGFQARPSHDELPLGFMTPDGTDSAAVKRKGTVDRWAESGGYYGRNEAQDKLPAQSYENKPLAGFKLGQNVRHGYGWGQGNVKWRIADPRGFELEISSPNFAQLIGFCTIQEGEILEDCIWARLGADNVLVPVNSDVYRATVRNTERVKKSASMRDIKIGDSAVLQNGDEGIYYGAFYVASIDRYSNGLGHNLNSTGKKRHVFLMQQPGADGVTSVKFFKAMPTPKLSEVFEAETPLTHIEAEKEVNRLIQTGIKLNESGANYQEAIGVSIEEMSISDFTQTEEPCTYQTLLDDALAISPEHKDNISYLMRYVSEGNVFGIYNGKLVQIDLYDVENKKTIVPGGSSHHPQYHSGKPQFWTAKFAWVDVAKFQATGELAPVVRSATQGTGYFSRQYNETVCEDFDVSTDTLPDLFRYRMNAKTTAGADVVFYR